MRRIAGFVLIGVGALCLTLAVLLPTVVVSGSKKTPLDLHITLVSTGPAQVFNATTNSLQAVQLRATRSVSSDSANSDSANTTVNEILCIVIVVGDTPNCVSSSDPRLLSYTTDRVTTARRSAEAVNVAKYGANVNGDTSVAHRGLAYKWPIDAKKITYNFFSPDLGQAFPARYQGTEKLKGLTVYKYSSSTGDQKYLIQGTFTGIYNDVRTVWVEPRTGAIIKGVEHQVQTLDNKQLALDTTLTFDDASQNYQANFAKDKIKTLRLAQLWGPLVLLIVGVLALIAAFLLLRRARSSSGAHAAGNEEDPRRGSTAAVPPQPWDAEVPRSQVDPEPA